MLQLCYKNSVNLTIGTVSSQGIAFHTDSTCQGTGCQSLTDIRLQVSYREGTTQVLPVQEVL